LVGDRFLGSQLDLECGTVLKLEGGHEELFVGLVQVLFFWLEVSGFVLRCDFALRTNGLEGLRIHQRLRCK
jgi:hypothetical protein